MTDDLSEDEFRTLHGLSKRVLWSNHGTRARLQRLGVNIVPSNFYSEIPSHDELEASFEYNEDIPFRIPACDDGAMAALMQRLAPFSAEFDPPKEKPVDGKMRFYWRCPAFSSLDAMFYYSFIRSLKPATVMEIGSGYSTLVAREALDRNGSGALVCIEPFPKDWLKELGAEIVVRKAQEVAAEYFNDTLKDGDVLFIDSTHTVKNGSDCLHLYLRVLPYLERRLTIHVHDIYLPYPLPKKSAVETQIYWTEQYLLAALMTNNPRLEFLISSVLAARRLPAQARQFMHNRFGLGGSSFWLEHRP